MKWSCGAENEKKLIVFEIIDWLVRWIWIDGLVNGMNRWTIYCIWLEGRPKHCPIALTHVVVTR